MGKRAKAGKSAIVSRNITVIIVVGDVEKFATIYDTLRVLKVCLVRAENRPFQVEPHEIVIEVVASQAPRLHGQPAWRSRGQSITLAQNATEDEIYDLGKEIRVRYFLDAGKRRARFERFLDSLPWEKMRRDLAEHLGAASLD